MSLQTKTLLINFKNEISQWEIPLFRGCVIQSMENANLLFHNHDDDKLRYAYPLIQYKRINKQASIVCIGEGTEAMGEFFGSCNFQFQLGERCLQMDINHIETNYTQIEVADSGTTYMLRKWLPFNSDNFNTYNNTSGLVQRLFFLQKILIGNMLSFCKGIGVSVDKEIHCEITDVINERFYIHKGNKKIGFDIAFKTNLVLPEFIGLGRGVSMGFGTVSRF